MQYLRICIAVLGFAASTVHAADFHLGYVAKTGDFNGDGKTDIFLDAGNDLTFVNVGDRLTPIARHRSEIKPFVLRQNAQHTFDIVTAISDAALAELRRWAVASAVKLVVTDLNGDWCIDLFVDNVAASITGAKNLIVFAPPGQGAAPTNIYAIDNAGQTFIDDIEGFGDDPDNYYDDAMVVVGYQTVQVQWSRFSCEGQMYGYPTGSSGELAAQSDPNCEFTGYFTVPEQRPIYGLDTANYSVNAYNINQKLEKYLDETGSFTVSASDLTSVISSLESEFGIDFLPSYSITATTVAGEAVLGPPGSLLWRIGLKRLGYIGWCIYKAKALLFHEYYYHYSYPTPDTLIGIAARGVKAGGYITKKSFTDGVLAMERLAMPPKDASDTPPSLKYYVIYENGRPKTFKFEAPVTWLAPPLTVTRLGGENAWQILQWSGAGSVEGPYPITMPGIDLP